VQGWCRNREPFSSSETESDWSRVDRAVKPLEATGLHCSLKETAIVLT